MATCGYCHRDYDDKYPDIRLSCGHRGCFYCLLEYRRGCQCGQHTAFVQEFIKLFETMKGDLKSARRENELAQEQNEALQNEKIERESIEKNSKDDQENNDIETNLPTEDCTVTCSTCGSIEKEDRMNVCTACTAKTYGIEVRNGEKIRETKGLDIDKLAICSTCILDNHVGTGHKIVKYYPILAATESDKYLPMFLDFKQKIGEIICLFEVSKKELSNNLEKLEKFQNMFELIRRSKSSEATKKLVEVISNRYEELQTMNQVIEESMRAHVEQSNKNIKNIEDEKRKLEEELCNEEKDDNSELLVVTRKRKMSKQQKKAIKRKKMK